MTLFPALLLLLATQFDDIAAKAAQARDADNLDQAVTLYRQAVRLRPSWAEGWWYLGTIAYDRKQFPEAVSSLSHVVVLAPTNANAFAMLGLSEAQLKQDRSALAHLTRALSLGIADEANLLPVVVFTRANLLICDGAYDRAQDALDELARQRPEEEELTLALGRSVMGIVPGPPLTSDARDLLIAAGHAEFLDANRQSKEAAEAYAALAERFPQIHNVQFAYGRFLLKNHLDDQAVAAFQREIANSPRHLLARLGIAGSLLLNDPAAALPYAEQAAQLAPKLAEAHFLFGACLLATGKTPQAIAELETARRLSPKDARIYFHLAKAYALAHRSAEAAQARAAFQSLQPPQTRRENQ